jgi:hypothetical protein
MAPHGLRTKAALALLGQGKACLAQSRKAGFLIGHKLQITH